MDFVRVGQRLADGRRVCEVRYYVGAVREDLARVREQRRFLRALREQGVEVFLGRIQRNRMSAQAAAERAGLRSAFAGREDEVPPDLWETLRAYWNSTPTQYKEKGVDTRISVDLVDLAYRDDYEVAYLLSADGDFVPAVAVARRLGKTVFAASPGSGNELKKAVNGYLKLSPAWFDGLYLRGGRRRSAEAGPTGGDTPVS